MKVKVWNDNQFDHEEKFRDQEIKIKAGGYIFMDYEEARMFQRQFRAPVLDHDDKPKPEGFKMIRIDKPTVAQSIATYICNRDGKKFHSQKELNDHIKANYANEIFKDEALEQEIAAQAPEKPKVRQARGRAA